MLHKLAIVMVAPGMIPDGLLKKIVTSGAKIDLLRKYCPAKLTRGYQSGKDYLTFNKLSLFTRSL